METIMKRLSIWEPFSPTRVVAGSKLGATGDGNVADDHLRWPPPPPPPPPSPPLPLRPDRPIDFSQLI